MTVPASIFRAYDIRGVVGDTLTEDGVEQIGRAIGSEAQARGDKAVIVGRDGRLSGPAISAALIRGIQASGADVIDIGMVPTPLLYFATFTLEGTTSGVMVTGSHNPPDYNGLKIVLAGETLYGEAITALYQRIQQQDLLQGQGQLSHEDVNAAYKDRVLSDFNLARPLKVVVDCGNGVPGYLAPDVIRQLGCDVTPMYCEVDGNFPNHHPDPGKPANLVDMIAEVKRSGADLGLAFDGDGDRVGVVTQTGQLIYPDKLMMLFAQDVCQRNPGAKVIFDVKCTGNLAKVIEQAGGEPEMWQTGHSLIKARMKATGAALAGEMSGHIFFKERWFGFDDGLYGAIRLLEILAASGQDADSLFSQFPEDISTPELNIQVTDETKFDLVNRLANEGQFGNGQVNKIDGIRVDYDDGWGLCRASNTTPVLVLRFEAKTDAGLERIRSTFISELEKIQPGLKLDVH
ncbi:phosphomannomutase/phosphoglucomutase [Oceanospirillum sediminis]|uniref:phosphomannomutase n=1 Tax=Oceanospirillum sediminis TaxID=2760088 RepID=A0A839INN1_9GAMM|nr:phosphomannomutase/phosphoglucomutase [Oceanospirillum sediminis]MBB1486548.1 phosphomannomutase/phosphoglucomutase [Oceanospirillum sediminis]